VRAGLCRQDSTIFSVTPASFQPPIDALHTITRVRVSPLVNQLSLLALVLLRQCERNAYCRFSFAQERLYLADNSSYWFAPLTEGQACPALLSPLACSVYHCRVFCHGGVPPTNAPLPPVTVPNSSMFSFFASSSLICVSKGPLRRVSEMS